ncbi:MAG: SAM-dependent methyltransferase, partial [Flavisolibacter sp.]|nr:SAM-dependent methyltransferase [Flavisolibacter sp.]
MSSATDNKRHPASYRDPSGFVFLHEKTLYRQVNAVYKEDYLYLMNSGCYQHLSEQGLLIPHKEINENFTHTKEWFRTLQPVYIPFISYPYEWCFSMLKDAALATLQIAKEVMQYGMLLKDASAYNVQLWEGRMVLIDTLSFERYDATKPWIAYRQFCEHFLAPIALMHYLKQPVQTFLLACPEGIPLSLTSKLLPLKANLNFGMLLHVQLHNLYATNKKNQGKDSGFNAQKLKNILNNLEQTIQSFHMDAPTGVWSNYYDEALEREDYVTTKKQIIEDWVQRFTFRSAVDLGTNEGTFSLLLAQKNISTISADFDHYSINRLYQKIKKEDIKNIHPIITDLANPTPAIGVNNEERASLLQRVHCDLVLALAFIHHLAIGKNIPIVMIANQLKRMGTFLIIEFVPKEDEKIKVMLSSKKDVYDWYNQESFEVVFSEHYSILERQEIAKSGRHLY